MASHFAIVAQLTDGQQYGLASIFLTGLVLVAKLLLDAHNNALAVRDAQINDLKAEKAKLVARLELLHDGKKKKP